MPGVHAFDKGMTVTLEVEYPADSEAHLLLKFQNTGHENTLQIREARTLDMCFETRLGFRYHGLAGDDCGASSFLPRDSFVTEDYHEEPRGGRSSPPPRALPAISIFSILNLILRRREEFWTRCNWEGEFTPLTEITIDEAAFAAWELSLADRGAVYVFRGEYCEAEKFTVRFTSVESDGRYRLTLIGEDLSREERACGARRCFGASRYA